MVVVAFFVLQLDSTKEMLAQRAEKYFVENFNGELRIGKLDGLIPFRFEVLDVSVVYYGSDGETIEADTVFSSESIVLGLDLWDMIRNRISVNYFNLENPVLKLTHTGNDSYTINRVFETPITDTLQTERPERKLPVIFAPSVAISSGQITIDHYQWEPGDIRLPQPLHFRNLDLQMYVELNSSQRFVDIESLSFVIPDLQNDEFFLSGQFYNDERYLEFNRVLFNSGKTNLSATFEIDGVDLTKPDIRDQFVNASYRLIMDSATLTPADYSDIIDDWGRYTSAIHLEVLAEGTMQVLDVNRFNMSYGGSDFFFYGQFTDLLKSESFSYDVILDYVRIRDHDIKQLAILQDFRFSDWDSLTTRGHINGTINSVDGVITVEPPRGIVTLTGEAAFRDSLVYSVAMQVDSLNLAHFPSVTGNNSNINLTVNMRGSGSDLLSSSGFWGLYARNTFLENYDIPMLDLELAFRNGVFEPEFFITEGTGTASGSGRVDMNHTDPLTQFSGNIDGFNLRNLIRSSNIPVTDLNANYSVNLKGTNADRLSGELLVGIRESAYNGEIIDSQSVVLTLNDAELGNRRLDLKSDIVNLTAVGSIKPSAIAQMLSLWKWEVNSRLEKRLWFADYDVKGTSEKPTGGDPIRIDLKGSLNNLDRVSRIYNAFPDIDTDSDFEISLRADHETLAMSGILHSRGFRSDSLVASGASITFNGQLKPADVRVNYLDIDLTADVETIDHPALDIAGISFRVRTTDDRWEFGTEIKSIGNDFTLESGAEVVVSDSSVVMKMDRFYLGDDEFDWKNSRDIKIIYDNNRRLIIDDLEISSEDGLVALNGVFSDLDTDSMRYSLEEVGLGAVSTLIGGRVSFEGKLNATVTTKTLTTSPTIEGDIFVDGLHLENRLIGDVNFRSVYNPVNRHFDTSLSVEIDEQKYADYRQGNNGVGNRLYLDGFFVPPNPENPADTVYYFDADLKEIDMWILPLIVSDIFEEVEGRSSGTGVLFGTLEDYYFNALFQLDRVYARPAFLNTDYTLSGPLELDRITGVFIDNVSVSDGRQGRGNLYGIVDLNDFEREKYLNISLTLDRLQFLNNRYSPEEPFYGNVTGTGEVNLIGLNTSPYLRTTQTIVVTSDSRLSIPLLDEASVEEQSRLIRYVTSFDEAFRPRADRTVEQDQPDENLGFMEIFQFDLQFVAPQNTTVQLVFDPVTGEIITARGNGRIRITLEDQTLQMFGRFDIDGGDYLFVGGDIFSRRFSIREGGSITWEGDPANARVDITAAYRSRPNIAPVDPAIPDDTPQRIPVDLVLVIRGNLDSIENEFYFEFPNATDASEYTTLLSIINNEEQKLIQATSLLFTGTFIQTGAMGTDTGAFGRDFQGRAAGQAGLSLLSNQITALLNSNLNNLNLDVDLNLTGLDQADLGVALRLFDDRLILRGGVYRDVYDESAEVSIGDLGVRYRINRALSVELFHRKDQRLALQQTETQVESVNGIGLEARVQFNTWRELGQRIWGSIRKIFVSSEERTPEVAESVE
ncbi:MAG: hypothetical protein EA364_10705 [Balneolaceae bacterium]|nr:MAG: hypothetical protein EA364_10705 [Balneolaceae bacterium]